MNYYLHSVAGRLRIKSPKIKNRKSEADNIRKALSTINGIGTVEINTVTGSVLVNYNQKFVSQNDIIDLMEVKGYFDRAKAANNDEYIKKAASGFGDIMGKAVLGAFVEKALEGSALSFLAILI
ncbi:MAG: copper chaperone [Nitrospirae bacterium]|nr:MAG: copper chaperone [Nitrospirota bacterium]